MPATARPEAGPHRTGSARHRTRGAACTTSKDTTLRRSLLNSTVTRWMGWFRYRYLSANPPLNRADAAASSE